MSIIAFTVSNIYMVQSLCSMAKSLHFTRIRLLTNV